MIPPITDQTTVTLPDGRLARLRLEYESPKAEELSVPRQVVLSRPVIGGIPLAPREVALQPLTIPAPTISEATRPKLLTTPEDWGAVFNHPAIGGPVTIFVLLYGQPYYDLHQRCLDTLIATAPATWAKIRVGANDVGPATRTYLQRLLAEGAIEKVYLEEKNLKKYPLMRKMFWDPACPIRTEWLGWFDDDSLCDKNPDWLKITCEEIIRQTLKGGCDMIGPMRLRGLEPAQQAYVKTRHWYRGRPFRDRAGKEIPNGTLTHFAVGAWWFLRTDLMRAADIPDLDLGHNGGDYLIGEQLWQNRGKLRNLNGNKALVNWSCAPRRGLNESHWQSNNKR